jgi:DNA-binding MarR family transcriptional regulator
MFKACYHVPAGKRDAVTETSTLRDENKKEGNQDGRPVLTLASFLPYRLNVLAALSSEGVAILYGARFGLSIPQWRIIATLGECGTATATLIGDQSHMHKTKVSRAVAELLASGMIRREINKADLRETLLTLTDEGRRIYEEIVPLARDYETRLIAGLSPKEMELIDTALSLLTQRASKLLDRIRTVR